MTAVTMKSFAEALMAIAYDRSGQLPNVHPAISDRLSPKEKALLLDSEELLLTNGWIEKNTDIGTRVLTNEGWQQAQRLQNNLASV